MDQSETAEHCGIFAKTQSDVRKRFWRCVAGETRRCFCRMSDQARPASEQCDDHSERGTWMPEHLNGKQRAANRTNDGMNGVPSGVDPRNFVGEKFEEIKNARDRYNHRISEHFERLIGRRERDPVEMNGEAGSENRQVKINAGEASKAEGDTEKVELFHDEIMRQR